MYYASDHIGSPGYTATEWDQPEEETGGRKNRPPK